MFKRMKCHMLLLVLAFVLAAFSTVQAQDGPLAENLEVKFMPGIMIDPGTGGSADLILLPKKLDWFVKPAGNLGLGSRLLSVNQTGQAVTTHAGGGLCLWEAICGSRVYDIQDKRSRWLFNAELLQIYALASGNAGSGP